MQKLKIGVINIPPFIFTDGLKYSGISVDIWKNISDSLDADYEYVYYKSFPELLDALKKNKVDFSICPLSVTSERLKDFQFTIPFYIAKLGMAERISYASALYRFLDTIFSWITLKWILFLFPVTFIFSFLIWITERKKNSEHFRKGYPGIGDGLWWAFVTMSTVGYGDKAPKTTLGRIITVFWMFTAIGIFVSVTGVLASELTVARMKSSSGDIKDLKGARVGTIAGSGYSRLLSQSDIEYQSYASIEKGLADVASTELDYFIYDETIMNYSLKETGLDKKMKILPTFLNLLYFCFPAPYSNKKLIDRINPVLINLVESNALYNILQKYKLGS